MRIFKFSWVKWNELRREWSKVTRQKVGYFYWHPGAGNGDLIYNTCREIIDRNDRSPWANNALLTCLVLLDEGKRWPDWMEKDGYVTTESHTQDQVTQDPWIMAYCCAAHLGRYHLIKAFPYRIKVLPDKWAWRDALLGKPKRWKRWDKILPYGLFNWWVYVFYGYMKDVI